MNNKIRTYSFLLIGICGVAMIFHFLILLKVIPYSVTWGGRLNSYSEVKMIVPISMAVNLLFILIVLTKAGFLNLNIPTAFLNGVLWVMAIIFGLNTIGNLVAITWLEKTIATPLTLIASLLSYKLARADKIN